MLFSDLGLNDALLKAVDKKGYTQPSPIQEKAIPVILQGKDIMASAQTGTGKTAGFTLPMMHILASRNLPVKHGIRALILTPTRELAAQIQQDILDYGTYLNLNSTVIFGGVSAVPQVSTIRKGLDILVATPGRLLDLYNQRIFKLDKVEFLVLDEADRMLDMGFARDLEKILQVLPTKRQNLLFSATFSPDIKKLANNILVKPVFVEASAENSTAEKVEQLIYSVDKSRKAELLIKLIKVGDWKQILVFTRTKHGANKLTKELVKHRIAAAAIHGNKSQTARTLALSEFKKGKIRVLVATDIAARGLDIPQLPYVVNYELPNVPESYVHRIGRTGRAGATGEAISLVSADEKEYIRGIEKLLGQKLRIEVLPGFEPSSKAPENLAVKKTGFRPKSNNRPGGGSNFKSNSRGKSTNSRKSGGSSSRKP